MACEEYEPNESDDDDNNSLYALNMEASGSREWFLYLGYMFGQLTNLTQLTFNGLYPEDEDLEYLWGKISASTSLTSLNYTNMIIERGCEEMLSAATAPNLTSITFQCCTIPNEIGCFLSPVYQEEPNNSLTTLCHRMFFQQDEYYQGNPCICY
jgi:hypothetical protein